MEINFPKQEQKILKYWKKNKIFEKSVKQRARARDFVFYEGPPTANARPGIHHVEARVYKDIICRYKTMRGFRVLRKAGWDTHGLPVELEIEKELGLKNKKDIEKYGIARFNKKCRQSVWLYKKEWEKLTARIGFWLDMEHPYVTYEADYIETLWWIIKRVWEKGLLRKDFKVVPYCPRCGTSLSSHEVALGYKKIKEPAIYIKFRIKGKKNDYLLVWTTTPWTLPGNIAIAVNPEFIYVKAKKGNDNFILAKNRLNILGEDCEIIQEINGKKLLGLEYEPFYVGSIVSDSNFKPYSLIAGNFISKDEGTGLVHIAPAFGEEDMEAVKKYADSAPILLTVDGQGKMITPGYTWNGLFVKDADKLIKEDLKKRGLLFGEEIYEHDYPFCWRCASPLLYYAKESWFVKITAIKDRLLENNKQIKWIPEHLKEGRFGEWLKEVKDWAFSRERYWGTPLPLWQCTECKDVCAIGSKQDLFSKKFSTNEYYVIRHGQTEYQTKKTAFMYPWPEKEPVFLTKEGEKQIRKCAQKLKKEKISIIYASDVMRTRQSAKIVSKELGGVKIVFDRRLRDINLGGYHGGTKERFYQDFPLKLDRFYDKKPAGGENYGQCRKRVFDALDSIEKKHKNSKILIVSHGDPLWLLTNTLAGLSDERILKIKQNVGGPRTGEIRKVEYKKVPLDEKGQFDPHRPYIDEVKFYCQKCGRIMKRVKDVSDVWFDSGAMPFAQGHWPFAHVGERKNRKLNPPELFPADYISEAVDQTRGWFYTLLAISSALGFSAPYENVISLGHVLDERGEKMSKSKGNAVNPWAVLDKYGADAVRWYFYTVNQPGEAKLFKESDIDLAFKKFILILWNCYIFFDTYSQEYTKNPPVKDLGVLDSWILSKLQTTIKNVTASLDNYDIMQAARTLENFVIEDLSQWYIRRSRRRLQKKEKDKDSKVACSVLASVLRDVCRLCAPFVPFISEDIYLRITQKKGRYKESLHLEKWPVLAKSLLSQELEKDMDLARDIVAAALAARARAGIKVRQPLKELAIAQRELQKKKKLLELIKDEVNVKNIIFGKTFSLDTEITPELKEEGMIREVIRTLQEERKRAGLKPKHSIIIFCEGQDRLLDIIAKNKKTILQETRAKDLVFKKYPKAKEIKVDGKPLRLGIQKI